MATEQWKFAKGLNFWRRSIYSIMLLSAALALWSCGGMINVRKDAPAEVDLPGVKAIAVLHFSCTNDRNIGRMLSDKMAMNIANGAHFTVVERNQIDKALRELGFQQDAIFDESSVVKIGNYCGADAVITGNVSVHECRDGHYTAQGQKGETWPVYTREVNCVADCKVILVESGILKCARTFRVKDNSSNRNKGDLTSCALMSEKCTTSIANSLFWMISPHPVKVTLTLDSGARAVKNSMKSGIEFANNGLYDRAKSNFLMVSESYPNASAPIYNLGIIAFMDNDLDEAEKLINKAIELFHQSKKEKTTVKSLKTYSDALNRIRADKERKARLSKQKQMAGRPQASQGGGSNLQEPWNEGFSRLVVIVNSANIRKGAGVSFDVVGCVGKGESLTIIGQSEDWYNIQAENGTKGWIRNDLVREHR